MAEESASAAATSAESLATGRASRLLISQLQTKPTASVIRMMKESSCCSRWAKAKSCASGTRAHEKPVLARERGVPAVEVQGGDRGNVECIAEEVAAGLGTVEAQRKAFVRRTRLPVAVGTEHRTQLQFRGRELLRTGHGKEIGAVVLQLRAGQILPQVVGQQLHADHAVNGAVWQDQGLAPSL